MTDTIAFAGPSIYGLDRSHFDQIEFRPPAAAGDILHAVRERPIAIGVIDGVYGDVASIWHKEILYALTQGVTVAGAASMGALRAAECQPFGMVGVGRIFADYASGARTADADVAVVHSPADLDFRPISVPLVDAEATLEGIAEHVSEHVLDRLKYAAKTLHFSRRTWKAIVSTAQGDADEASDLVELLRQSHRHIKRDDALLLLQFLAAADFHRREDTLAWTFQDTAFFRQLERRTTCKAYNT